MTGDTPWPLSDASSGQPLSAIAGQPFSLPKDALAFTGETDYNSLFAAGQNPSTPVIVTFSWNDPNGQPTPPTLMTDSDGWTWVDSDFVAMKQVGPGEFHIAGTHTFPVPGTYTITATIGFMGALQGKGGDPLDIQATVDVKPIPQPTINLSFSNPSPQMGQGFSLVATITNPGDVDADYSGNYTYQLQTRPVMPGDAYGTGAYSVEVPAHSSKTIVLHTYNYTWDWIPRKDLLAGVLNQVNSAASSLGNWQDPNLLGQGLLASFGALGAKSAGLALTIANAIGPLFDALDAASQAVIDQGLHAEATVGVAGSPPTSNAQASTEIDVPAWKKADLAGFIAADTAASLLFSSALPLALSGNLPATVSDMQLAIASMLLAEVLYGQALDPPDADYKTLPTATFADGTTPDTNPVTSGTPKAVRLLLTAGLDQAAAAIAIDRSQGADAAGDAGWKRQQLAAAAGFYDDAAAAMAQVVTLAPGYSPVTGQISDSGVSELAADGLTPDQIAGLSTALLTAASPTADGRNPLSAALQSYVSADLTLAKGALADALAAQPAASPTEPSPADRSALAAMNASIAAAIEAGDSQGGQLPSIAAYKARSLSVALATNNLAALQSDLAASDDFLTRDLSQVVAAQPPLIPPVTTAGSTPTPPVGMPGTAPATASTPLVLNPPGSGVVTTPIQAIPNSPDARFVTTLYGEILGRTPEAKGLSYWMRELHGKISPSTAGRLIWRSPEHRSILGQHAGASHGHFGAMLSKALRARRHVLTHRPSGAKRS